MRALQSSQQVLSRHNHWQQLVPQHAAAVLSSQRQRQRQQWCVCALALEQQPQAHAAFSSTAGSSTTTQQQPHQQQQHSAVASWPGLTAWRAKAVDNGLVWGPKNKPIAATTQQPLPAAEQLQLPGSLVGVALLVLNTACPHQKAALAHRGWQAYRAGHICLHPEDQPAGGPSSPPPPAAAAAARQHTAQESLKQQQQQQQHSSPPDRPARPDKPELVVPKLVPSPKDSPLPLSAHLLHNLAHIELNAVDLAMDTVARFAHLRLPDAFYEDFARVADDEARHFGWCVQRMAELGHSYGDLVAHDLLWEGAQASSGDLAARLAIVPMSQEARGLDAGQRLATRLVGAGDNRSASIVKRIAEEERAHVAVGVEWFGRVCAAMDVDAPSAFRALVASLGPELLKGPFAHDERQLVGLQRQFYDMSSWPEHLQQQVVKPAVAATAKGKGLPLPMAADAAQQQQQPPPPQKQQQQQQQEQQPEASVTKQGQHTTLQELLRVSAVPQSGPQLEQLRQRLWEMLQGEAVTCNV